MGNKYTPLDAESDTRILDVGRVQWTWRRPWACFGCRRYGEIPVSLPPPLETRDDDPRWKAATTNGQMAESAERGHHELSPFCVVGPGQRLLGRVYRFKGGEKIYLRANGEREEDVRHQKWPPWPEGT